MSLSKNNRAPVLFLVFNRPELTRKVFEKIRVAKPPKLYVAADGPREHVVGEDVVCNSVRRIATDVDWTCEVFTLFREKNMGCGRAVSSAITWFFQNEEQGIILEDDCLPSDSFFVYVNELLDKYKTESRIGLISGTRMVPMFRNGAAGYQFTRYPIIWGWGSWRRVWNSYSFEFDGLQEDNVVASIVDWIGHRNFEAFWKKRFHDTRDGLVDTWDYQLVYTLFRNKHISIIPPKNLVKNIGFGADATHTSRTVGLTFKSYDIPTPVTIRQKVEIDESVDLFLKKNYFSKFSSFRRISLFYMKKFLGRMHLIKNSPNG